ncbi:hypothetical protein LINPERHAP1_LOCUS37223 [Linum perenne]
MDRDLLRKFLRICSILILILSLIVAVVFFGLSLLSLKPTIGPLITIYPLGGEEFSPAAENATAVAVVFGVDNRNYGSYEFGNASAGYFTYDGEPAGGITVVGGRVPARSKRNFTAQAAVVPWVSNLTAGVNGGVLNLTAVIVLDGRMGRGLTNLLKLDGPVYSDCSVDLEFRSPS